MEDPDFWNNQEEAEQKAQALSQIKELVSRYDELKEGLENNRVLADLGAEEEDREVLEEAHRNLKNLKERLDDFELLTLLDGENDKKQAFLSIQAGAGGIDAADWAQILWRMYASWLDANQYEYDVVDLREGEEAGIKHVNVHIKEEYAFGYLKSEIGVHRLIRISPFDAGGRRHTSFAAVDVTPEMEDIDVEIDENDLEIDFYRASGAGGQHVNRTASAVRITYKPEDVTVQCQNERSQHTNRRKAMKMLRSRLYALKEQRREEQLQKMYGQKGDISWGNQIRSYYFDPQERVKDHRTDEETHDVESVLNGDIQPFIDAYLRQEPDEG